MWHLCRFSWRFRVEVQTQYTTCGKPEQCNQACVMDFAFAEILNESGARAQEDACLAAHAVRWRDHDRELTALRKRILAVDLEGNRVGRWVIDAAKLTGFVLLPLTVATSL